MCDLRLAAIGIFDLDRERLLPRRKRAIRSDSDLIPIRTLAVIDRGGPAIQREKAGAAEHAVTREGRLELRRLPAPVEHVGTGDMDEGKRLSILPGVTQDVVQMADTIDVKRRIRIARHARAAGMHEM